LAKAIETFRAQEQRYTALSASYEEERTARLQCAREEQRWMGAWKRDHDKVLDLEDQLKRAGIAPRPNYQWTTRGPSVDDVLRDLLQIAHPDRWSQQQPASALAHEIAVAINAVRAKLEARP
jgi:hypothetical protein